MAKLLIVDDEKNIRNHLSTFFETCGHQVRTAESAAQALALIAEEGNFDLVLSDYRMAEMNGLELLQRIKRDNPQLPVILMTAYGTVESAVTAMKSGAYDYVTKPFSLDQIQHVVVRALEVQSLRAEVHLLRGAIEEQPLLESRSPAMRHLLEVAHQAAASEATILLMGESGTGKNVLARQIHQWSRRSKGPFVVVNCTTLSENLLESELFGHMRGSFTGAFKDKPGRLEAANTGTVFLDEIADLSAVVANQVFALRAGATIRARRRRPDHPGRHPDYRGLQPRSAGRGHGASFSRGSLLPAQCHCSSCARPAQAPRGHPAVGRALAGHRGNSQPSSGPALFARSCPGD